MRTWILTGSPENLAATREHGYRVIGLKERVSAHDASLLLDRLGAAAATRP